WTMVTGFFGAAPAAGATGGWEDLASPHPAARAVTRMMARVRMSLLQRAANGGLELIERGVVVAERAVVVQRLLAIGPLGVEVVQQSHAASLVGELDRVSRLLDLWQVRVTGQRDLCPLRRD